MALEDLTGSKYIDSLNPLWPDGDADYPNEGDDHLRGIKNVLTKTFPNLAGPVTRDQDDLNRGSVEVGSRTVFYQAAAPDGWLRVEITDTAMMRVVADTSAGGGFGGTDDPILNDTVPAHEHDLTITSGGQSATHTHAVSGNTSTIGNHTHSAQVTGGSGGTYPGTGGTQTNLYPAITGAAGSHAHTLSLTSGNASASHTHEVDGTTRVNTDGADWTPRYIDMVLCERA